MQACINIFKELNIHLESNTTTSNTVIKDLKSYYWIVKDL